MSRRKILVADLLCGAGGSSTGCERALKELGLEMDLVCVNHWQTAIDTHTLNHPTARHYVQDIATVRPHLLVPEGYLDLLMASPTCTHHSVARGGKPTSDQQRSDPWHIITWLTEVRVKRGIIENVWEFTGWGPVDPKTMKPIPSRKGEYFNAWIETIRRLGYDPQWRKLNAADYGDATTRQRFILMMRNDRKPVYFPAPTHIKKPDEGLALFPTMKPWRPAREIIDWGIKGRSIFGRKKDLAPKTMARIFAGAVKHGWPQPYIVILRNHMVARGMDDPLPALTGGGTHIGLAQPVIVNLKGRSPTPTPASEPLPTQTEHAHIFSAEPIVMSHHNSGVARSADEPVPTMTTAKGGEFALVVPVTHDGGLDRVQDDGGPLPTITGANRGELAFIVAQHGERQGQAPRVHSIDDPTPTIAASGHTDLVMVETDGYDILFRMLEPHELAAAMGFTDEDQAYEFAGTKTDQIKQIGNAVSVAKMKACVGAIMADAAPRQRPVPIPALAERVA